MSGASSLCCSHLSPLTPDLFRVSREDGSLLASEVARKPVRLALRPDGAVVEEEVPAGEQATPSLRPESLSTLAEYARRIESHYGAPQDIEWALDREGRILLLQTRPLRVFRPGRGEKEVDVSALSAVRSGGTTVCLMGASAMF